SSEKFLAIFAEDLKDIGIRFEIDKKDLAAWMKDMDKFNFDMTWAAWGGSLRPDPEGMWLSREADRVGGNNVTGFRDDRVDRIIEEQKSVFDIHRRQELLRELDRI
ncbi:MAG: ABC transporter substrate-binding protein, partial [Nitrospinaceae bacterium]|nr:ABC transporter substrate-binding protein [Nitrospinaceae bacterium]